MGNTTFQGIIYGTSMSTPLPIGPIIFRSQYAIPPNLCHLHAVYGFMSGVVLEDVTCSLDWWLSPDGQDNPRLCTIREAGVVALQALQALETLHARGAIHM